MSEKRTKPTHKSKKSEPANQNEGKSKPKPRVLYPKELQKKGRSESLDRRDSTKVPSTSKRTESVDRGTKGNRLNPKTNDQKKGSTTQSNSKIPNKYGSPVKQVRSSDKQSQLSSQSKIKSTISTPSKSRVESKPAVGSKSSKAASSKQVPKKKSDDIPKKSSQKTEKEKTVNSSRKEVKQSSKNDRKESNHEPLIRPTTSTIRKVSSSQHQSKQLKERKHGEHSAKTEVQSKESTAEKEDNEADSYEEDFEEYESDFEEDSKEESVSESDDQSSNSGESSDGSISDPALDGTVQKTSGLIMHPTIVKRQAAAPPKIAEKSVRTEFLRMSTRSSTFLVKDAADSSPVKRSSQPPHMIINFASAMRGQEKKKLLDSVQQRGKDLLELLTLDTVSYEIFEMPSMTYDVFIKTFGRANFKQALVQTEFSEEDETQTDEIDCHDKWTQNPSYDHFEVGGDSYSAEVDIGKNWQSHFKIEAVKLNKFLQNITPIFLNILSQTLPRLSTWSYSKVASDMTFSSGCYILEPLPFCKGSPVTFVCYSPKPCTYFLAIHGNLEKLPISTPFSTEKGLISLWHIFERNKPEMMLIANSQPTCACFGPPGHDTVIAGMVDGSIVLWDLKEPSQVHKMYNEDISMRSPTFNTAALLDETHHSCVVAIHSFDYSKSQPADEGPSMKGRGKSYHIFSLDEMGILNVWIVVEVPKADPSDIDSDLALSPEGKVKLTWSSSISLMNVNSQREPLFDDLRAFDFQIFPSDGNHVVVGTDVEMVYHLTRNNRVPDPSYYTRKAEKHFEVRCISFSPHSDEQFVVGCSDGSAMLFNVKRMFSILTIPQVADGESVVFIEWSQSCPTVLFALDSNSGIHIWDIMENTRKPKLSYTFSSPRVLWFTTFDFQRNVSKTIKDVPSHLVLAKGSGDIEIHALENSLGFISTEDYEKQMAFMQSL